MKNVFKKITKPLRGLLSKIKSVSIKQWSVGFLSLGAVILLGLGSFWYVSEYNKKERINERRFWSAIETALNTQSVVKTTKSGASGKLDTNQQRIFLSGDRLVQVHYSTEVNNPAQSYELTIDTEALQYFNGKNYIRYTNYESTEGTSLGEYIGDWAIQEVEEERIDGYQEQYAGGLVSVVAFADLPPALRADIIQKLQDNNVYTLDIKNAMTREEDGEQVVQIPLTISLREYIRTLNEVFSASGYPDLGLEPDSAGEGTLNANVEIRTRDSVITKIVYGTITEEYSNYGVVERPEEPTAQYTYEELQQAVQKQLTPNN